MKKIVLLVTIFFLLHRVYAQDELKARVEYQNAEKDYEDSSYQSALQHLSNTETLLNKWTPKVSYLKIKTLDKLANSDVDKYSPPLKDEVGKYMQYANANQNKVNTDEFKDIYAILTEANFPDIRKGRLEIEKNESDLEYNAQTNAIFQQAEDEIKKQEAKDFTEHYADADYTLAISLLNKAIDRGSAVAMFTLGDLYFFGKTVMDRKGHSKTAIVPDYDKGISLLSQAYHKAVDEKNDILKKMIAKTVGGNYLMDSEKRDFPYSETAYSKALEWLQKAADEGDAFSMWEISDIYKHGGHGIQKDKALAAQWLQKAKDAGYTGN